MVITMDVDCFLTCCTQPFCHQHTSVSVGGEFWWGPSVHVIERSDCSSSWLQECHGMQGTACSDMRWVIALCTLYSPCSQFMAWRLQAE
jgi:hypothetical protein